MRHAGRAFSSIPDPLGEEGRTAEKESDLHSSIDLEGTLQRQSLTSRKRVLAFSKDQEEMIKALFEHCSSVSKTQATWFTCSVVPWQKNAETKMHLQDEELNGFSGGGGQASDDEILLSLWNRGRNNESGRSFGELSKRNKKREFPEDSDDEYLSSLLKHRNEDGNKSLPEEQDSEEELSDNEFLDSVLKMLRPNAKSRKLTTISVERELSKQNLGDGIPKDVAERDVISPIEMDVEEIHKEIISHSQEDTSEFEATGTGSISKSPSASEINNEDDLMDGALADFTDDAAFGTLIKLLHLGGS